MPSALPTRPDDFVDQHITFFIQFDIGGESGQELNPGLHACVSDSLPGTSQTPGVLFNRVHLLCTGSDAHLGQEHKATRADVDYGLSGDHFFYDLLVGCIANRIVVQDLVGDLRVALIHFPVVHLRPADAEDNSPSPDETKQGPFQAIEK